MELGIIGFWHAGKSTVFNALCAGRSETLKHRTDGWHSHLADIIINDPAAGKLSEKFEPKKTTLAHMRVVDIDGPPATTEDAGHVHKKSLLEYQLQNLATTDAYIAVIRAFEGQDIPPRDIQEQVHTIIMELILSDLSKIEHRLPGLEKNITRVGGEEKDTLLVEKGALERARDVLANDTPLTKTEFSPREEPLIRGFQFASRRPILFIINTDDEDDARCSEACTSLDEQFSSDPYEFMLLNAEIETEILELPQDEQKVFMDDYNITVPAKKRVVHSVMHLMNLLSFYTVNPNELRVWLVTSGTTAIEAAGMIHTDFARGFIRAEVNNRETLLEVGGFSEAKHEGVLRTEGKEYIVKDGDVINFLFNV